MLLIQRDETEGSEGLKVRRGEVCQSPPKRMGDVVADVDEKDPFFEFAERVVKKGKRRAVGKEGKRRMGHAL